MDRSTSDRVTWSTIDPCSNTCKMHTTLRVSSSLEELEFAPIRKEGSNRSHRRVKSQKEQGSESVNEKPRSHTYRTPPRTKCCGALRACHAPAMDVIRSLRRWRGRGGRDHLP